VPNTRVFLVVWRVAIAVHKATWIIVRVKNIPFGIWGMVGLKEEFEKALERKVDLLSEQGMSKSFASRIKKDLVTVYGQG
jgi:hypothetical protein